MATGAAIARRYWQLSALNALGGLVIAALAAFQVGTAAYNLQAGRSGADAQETLNVQAEALNGALDKYRMLPVILGHRPDVAELLRSGGGSELARRIALSSAGISGALDVMFARPDGSVFARSAAASQDTIAIGSTLMTAALQGRLGRQVRLLNDGKRVYVFTAGIWDENRVIGIVAVYVDLEVIEDYWSLIGNPILATDATNTVVMSNRPQWRMLPRPDFSAGVTGGRAGPDTAAEVEYLPRSRVLPPLNWNLTVLTDAAPIHLAGTLWGGLAAAVVAVLTLAVQALIGRHFAAVRRTRGQRANALRLERIVRDRTRELLVTNQSLADAVEQLRRTQTELIQTGKLAALGQMSTALSHEINQPLSAVKTYAENALTYLRRGREPEARENISRIAELTDRMASISRHLRNFARKPNPTFGTAPIGKVIEEALQVVASRLREQRTLVETDLGPALLLVRGGPVRLQQVIVNLVLNALDAMGDEKSPRIAISVTQHDDRVRIEVSDNGPGIDPVVLDRIFDPFFTTKEVGQGLGLGLSISYNIVKDFGGQLSVQTSQWGGASFVVELEQGETLQDAAQ